MRWWTKAWFNNREEGEPSVEIEERNAIMFIHRQMDKEEWMEKYFPQQMGFYHKAIQQTREQLITQLNSKV